MADDAQPEGTPAKRRPTTEQIIEFFGRKGADAVACPICSARKGWSLLANEHIQLTLPDIKKALNVYAASCNNCQFVRLHGKKSIDADILGHLDEGSDGQ